MYASHTLLEKAERYVRVYVHAHTPSHQVLLEKMVDEGPSDEEIELEKQLLIAAQHEADEIVSGSRCVCDSPS